METAPMVFLTLPPWSQRAGIGYEIRREQKRVRVCTSSRLATIIYNYVELHICMHVRIFVCVWFLRAPAFRAHIFMPDH